ncbi:hypothetical protein BDZ97DRAFT_119282 [Flammula alnicola]|nr:hypothetical protein BDZ97DRAFT_119282 [Flammula alnicola]
MRKTRRSRVLPFYGCLRLGLLPSATIIPPPRAQLLHTPSIPHPHSLAAPPSTHTLSSLPALNAFVTASTTFLDRLLSLAFGCVNF